VFEDVGVERKMSEGKTPLSDSEEDDSTMGDSESDSLTPSGEEDSSTLTGEESDEFELNTNATLSTVSLGQKKAVAVNGQHYDEAMELSASEQSVMSDVGAGGAGTQITVPGAGKSTTAVAGEHYDEAMELSASESMMSTDEPGSAIVIAKSPSPNASPAGQVIKNARHDEEIVVDSDESLSSSIASATRDSGLAKVTGASSSIVDSERGDSPPSSPPSNDISANTYKDLVDEKQKDVTEDSMNMAERRDLGDSSGSSSTGSDTGSDSETSDSDDDTPSQKRVTPLSSRAGDGPSPTAAYNKDYSHLNVSDEIQTMFKYIGNFKPIKVEIDSKLKCFIPDFTPAIGNLDNFVKVPRPDSKPDQLGLAVVDEPAVTQSDATVLELQFLSSAKTQMAKRLNIRSIERAEKSPAEITRWIESIADLHRNKPPPTVTYKKPMPDVESLMQVWPEEFEAELPNFKIPPGEIDLTVKEYASISCGLVDIPVYDSTVQALHVLFTLYSEFRSNQHFTNHLTENADEAVELSDEEQETPPSSPSEL